MKTKGIVRQMDDLGRIVIPREIRNRIGAVIGDQFEMSLNADNSISLSLINENPTGVIIVRALKSLDDDYRLSTEQIYKVQEKLNDALKIIKGE